MDTETDDTATSRDEIVEALHETDIPADQVEELAEAAEDYIDTTESDDNQAAESDDASDGEGASQSGEGGDTTEVDGSQTAESDDPSDGEGASQSGEDGDATESDHPAKQTLDTPLRGRESFLAQGKRESVDLSRDDIKFLALVADAFRDDLDGYTLTESMNDFDKRAGHPDIDGLIDDGYVEKMTVNRKTYYSLTRKAWRLINDGVPGNTFGDYMEKIEHRIGVYLLAEYLKTSSVATVEEYGRHNGETYDVIAYDSDGEIHTVGEVETSSNNKQAVIEDYEKLADAPGRAAWVCPKNPVFEEIWDLLDEESLVDSSNVADWQKERTSKIQKPLNENPQPGMDSVFVYSQLRDSIGGGEQ